MRLPGSAPCSAWAVPCSAPSWGMCPGTLQLAPGPSQGAQATALAVSSGFQVACRPGHWLPPRLQDPGALATLALSADHCPSFTLTPQCPATLRPGPCGPETCPQAHS